MKALGRGIGEVDPIDQLQRFENEAKAKEEGDPEAAALFWQFAMSTNGAFIAPSRDWP